MKANSPSGSPAPDPLVKEAILLEDVIARYQRKLADVRRQLAPDVLLRLSPAEAYQAHRALEERVGVLEGAVSRSGGLCEREVANIHDLLAAARSAYAKTTATFHGWP